MIYRHEHNTAVVVEGYSAVVVVAVAQNLHASAVIQWGELLSYSRSKCGTRGGRGFVKSVVCATRYVSIYHIARRLVVPLAETR